MKTISFSTTIKKFASQGEKTGWTYIDIPSKIATLLAPGNKKSFRIKGKLDEFSICNVALLPMGNGDFIMALNVAMRKGIKKQKGATINISIETDNSELPQSKALLECLKDEPEAAAYFNSLAPSHRFYYTKWIEAAKSEITKINRIALAVNTLSRRMNYSEMLREQRDNNKAIR
ncbi:MAG: YdeI/OmpD-associated family protein [Ferruginibacter sp.]